MTDKTHFRTTATIASVLLLAGVVIVISPASAQDAGGRQVELTYRTGAEALRAITPCKALNGGKPFTFAGESGELVVAGSPVKFGVIWHERLQAFLGAMDCDGSGKLDEKEFVKLSQTLSATYQVKVDGKSHTVRVADLRIFTRGTANGSGISSVRGGYVVCGFHQGSYDTTMIRLFDEDMDGKFTQDGKDAIMIGRAGAAIPLGKIHQVGSQHCQLTVAEDGSKVTITPLRGIELGLVETSFRRGLKCLALMDEEGHSYDLAVSGKTGIPAGKYKLRYGLLVAGGMMTIMKPTKACPTYEIQAGKVNTLRLGKPIWVSFMANYSAGNVRVSPSVTVYGAAGEEYSFDFSGGTGRPHVLMKEGSRTLQDIPMSYG